jgi:hypothetical protein
MKEKLCHFPSLAMQCYMRLNMQESSKDFNQFYMYLHFILRFASPPPAVFHASYSYKSRRSLTTSVWAQRSSCFQ